MTLTVPPSAAGVQGPCPKCWQEIISPDPARGLAAKLVEALPAAPVAVPAPIEPPPVATGPEPAMPAGISPVSPPVANPRRISWVLPTLASLVVGSTAGYFIGRTQPSPVLAPQFRTEQAKPKPDAPRKGEPPAPRPDPAPVPKSSPEPAKPETAPANPPVPPAETPAKERISADAALRAFLEAPDSKTRTELVIFPDDMRPSIEKRAAELGDGPFAVTSVALIETSGPSHIYKVSTAAIPEGFPVSVMETKDGAKVNWESFVNFHDDLFRKFAAGPAEATGVFHVLVKPDPPATGEAESSFSRFKLSVPMAGREQLAWIRKDSVALAKLRGVFERSGQPDQELMDRLLSEEGLPFSLKLAKRQPNERQQFIEIIDFVAIGWLPGTE